MWWHLRKKVKNRTFQVSREVLELDGSHRQIPATGLMQISFIWLPPNWGQNIKNLCSLLFDIVSKTVSGEVLCLPSDKLMQTGNMRQIFALVLFHAGGNNQVPSTKELLLKRQGNNINGTGQLLGGGRWANNRKAFCSHSIRKKSSHVLKHSLSSPTWTVLQ